MKVSASDALKYMSDIYTQRMEVYISENEENTI